MFNHIQHEYVLPELECETLPTGRTYMTPEGNKYPSVTTVLSTKEGTKEGLDEWRKRVGDIEADKISRQAAHRGTVIHQICEDYLDNKSDWKRGVMPSNLLSFSHIRPILDKNVNNIIAQEIPLYSDKLKTAGRVDCIAEWNKELAIIDFKTSRRDKKKEWITSYFMQMAFYAAAFYERTGVPIKKGVIVMIVDDGPPRIFEVNTFDYLSGFISLRNSFSS